MPSVRSFGDFVIRHAGNFVRYSLRLPADRQFRCRSTGWVNIKSEGEWHHPHIHHRAVLSYVYYIDAPDDGVEIRPQEGRVTGGLIQFQDPRGSAPYMFSDLTSVFGASVRFVPEEGMLLIFPSFLMHLVVPIISQQRRISIGGNLSSIQVAR